MGSRFVRPDSDTLKISDGDWLLVKRRLTSGETRDQLRRSYRVFDGRMVYDPVESGMALVTSYLLDWSLLGDDGKPIVIRGLMLSELTTVLDALDPDHFGEIRKAIEKYEKQMDKARAQEKKLPGGASTSSPPSTSRDDVTGDTNGSTNLTQTSSPSLPPN